MRTLLDKLALFFASNKTVVISVYKFFKIENKALCNNHQENMYPLKPHFYIVKLGFAGVYLFFLFLLQNIDCGYSLEQPRRGGSNVYPQSMF